MSILPGDEEFACVASKYYVKLKIYLKLFGECYSVFRPSYVNRFSGS